MIEGLTPTAKVSVSAFSILVLMTSVFVAAVNVRDIMYPYVDIVDNSAPEVAGVTATRTQETVKGSVPTSNASISVIDDGDGKASLYLKLDSLARVSAVDLSFFLYGGIEIVDLKCEDGFECASLVITDDNLRFIAFRPPNEAGELWSGETKIASISYTYGTTGILEMNGPVTRPSEVVEFSTEKDLLAGSKGTFELGQ